ncbi:MAG: AAA family ATPase [Candidatus Roizmanbacteria bacterium]|nr:AAA family ATPase [Candidatus Roizmanbacteria bacterium]
MPNPLLGWYNLLVFIPYYFSMGTLLATFFTPWKRYYWKRKKRGLHIGEFLYVVVSNLISRLIGVFLRTVVLIIGFAATLSAIVFGLPLVLILSILNPDSFIFNGKTFSLIRGFAWDWHYGYTPLTDEFSQELYFAELEVPLIGRDREKEAIMRVLTSQREKNIVLIGEPGSGRRALLTDLSHEFSYLRFLYFDWVQCFKGIPDPAQQQAKLEDILFEVRHAGNVVLILPNMHELIGFATIFEQYLNRTDLHVVGLSTPANYHADILPNQSFMKYFITVDTNPLPKHLILKILANKVAQFSSRTKHAAMLSADVLETIYTASRRLESTEQKHQPEAALSLLFEFVGFLEQKMKDNQSVQSVLEQFVEERLEVPFGALTNTERQILKNLETKLHERIVDQDEAINEIAGALRRRQLKLSSENKPIGSFLFLGPTGVGKTETAKALAALFFDPSADGEKKLIRFDMSPYQHEAQMEDLIQQLAQAIRETPYAVLLLDELEKANTSILNLFLTILDEGYFTDTNRSTVLCSNLIIIGTSNAGSEFIREHLQHDSDHTKHEGKFNARVMDYILHKGTFSPEFLNRFDAVVVYTPLTDKQLKEIARMKIEKIRIRLQKTHHKTFSISESMIDHVVEEGAHKEFGARELDRTIRRLVEEPLAEKLLE